MTYLLLTIVFVLLTALWGYKLGDTFRAKAGATAYQGLYTVSLLISLALILLKYRADNQVLNRYKQAVADSGKALDNAQSAVEHVEKTARAAKTRSEAMLNKMDGMRQKEALIQAQLKQHGLFADYENGILRPVNKSL